MLGKILTTPSPAIFPGVTDKSTSTFHKRYIDKIKKAALFPQIQGQEVCLAVERE